MIPIRLKLRNFMCYRDNVPPLDFSGIHLACLAGQNGHGKSALLDAMTWALWGKARTAHDNDLITLGQEEMEVEFDFRLGNNLYRVIRKRSSRGRGQSSLELQVESNGRFQPLSEPTMRQTEDKIKELLRIDYDTFINSAFLLQGRADEFTTKTPADRKRTLGEILGLSIYDVYEQRAREKGKEAEINERQVEARIQEIGHELEHESQYEAERRQAEEMVARLSQELRAEEEGVNRLRQEKKALDMQRKQWEELGVRVARTEKELKDLAQRLAAQEERLAHFELAIERRAEIEAGYTAWQEARSADNAMNTRLSRLVKLQDERNPLEQQITRAKEHLESQKRFYSDQLAELQKKAEESGRFQVALAEIQQKLKALAEQEALQDEKRRQIQELSNETSSFEALNKWLKEDMESLREKISLLQGAEAKCPLCGSSLSRDDQVRIIADLEAEGKQKGDQYRANKARLLEMKEAATRLEEECQDIEQALRARVGLQREEAALEQALKEAEEAHQEQGTVQDAIAQVEAQLATENYAIEAQAGLSRIEEEIADLGYDEAKHEAARREVERLQRFEQDKQELDLATRSLENERGIGQQLRHTHLSRSEDLEKDKARLAELEGVLAGAAELEPQLSAALERLEALRNQESRARLGLGAAQQKLEHCKSLRAEREQQTKRLRQLAEDKGLYRDLQTAFGQKGLRAMIIESAIPEIEEEANRLLARMTDNRMHLRFETQRETLKGDTVETLDIKIADELGTRNYEMYSGGEAFRMNFAIRIALSKLLARRAGAQLQTLIIDEGFGTQDAQGRERLVEAINSIRDDFACILVITHIEELQDVFPVRINVFKTPQGSRFEVD